MQFCNVLFAFSKSFHCVISQHPAQSKNVETAFKGVFSHRSIKQQRRDQVTWEQECDQTSGKD